MKRKPDLVILPDHAKHTPEQLYRLTEILSADFTLHILDYPLIKADTAILARFVHDCLQMRVSSPFHMLGLHYGARISRRYASLFPHATLSASEIGKDIVLARELRAYEGSIRDILHTQDQTENFPVLYHPSAALS